MQIHASDVCPADLETGAGGANATQTIATTGNPEPPSAEWQRVLAGASIGIDELLARVGLSNHDLGGKPEDHRQQQASGQFRLRVPEPYIARIRHGDPNDPLLRQVLPNAREMDITPGYTADPLDESAYNPLPGLIHKYHNRVLLLVTQACGIHCRYCFRRHFPYETNILGRSKCKRALTYINSNSNLDEVILSGGDPLAANDKHLGWLAGQLATIPHIRRLRIHTRLPVVLPQRVDKHLVDWLLDWPGQKILVIHCNHPQEIDRAVTEAMARLASAGVTLLNQSVLLKGVNDDEETLRELSNQLFSAGVMPYYLHQLDKVQGAAHFRVSETRARRLLGQLGRQLPGYLVPRLVQEQAGASAKIPLAPIF